MDHFTEEVVVKKNRVLNEVLYYIASAAMLILAVFALYQLPGILIYATSGISLLELLPGILLTAGAAAISVLLYLYRGRLRTEYEYTFTNGELDFAQVFNNNKRNTLGTLNVGRVEAFGPVAGKSFQRFLSMPGIQQTRWFLNRDANLHYFYFQKNGNKRLIIFEPSAELVSMIKLYLPHGVYQE